MTATDASGDETAPQTFEITIEAPKVVRPSSTIPSIEIVTRRLEVAAETTHVTISCTHEICDGSLMLRQALGVKKTATVLGTARFLIAKGSTAMVVIHLNANGRRDLTRAKGSPISTVLIANVDGGKQIAARLTMN